MFAVVRTGGKQYRVSAGDKIAVEKLVGDAGDTIQLGDVLLAGDGGEIKDVAGLTVAAEIIAQAKSEKVTVFKKRRRHNYRRKAGHRQQMTLLRIVQVGDSKYEKTAAPTAEAAPMAEEAPVKAETTAKAEPAQKVETVSATEDQTPAKKPAAKKAPAKKAEEK
jgi:large subunit ribosomal protein L21